MLAWDSCKLAIRHFCAILGARCADAWTCTSSQKHRAGPLHWLNLANSAIWGHGRRWGGGRKRRFGWVEWVKNSSGVGREQARQELAICQISTLIPKWHGATFSCSCLFICTLPTEVKQNWVDPYGLQHFDQGKTKRLLAKAPCQCSLPHGSTAAAPTNHWMQRKPVGLPAPAYFRTALSVSAHYMDCTAASPSSGGSESCNHNSFPICERRTGSWSQLSLSLQLGDSAEAGGGLPAPLGCKPLCPSIIVQSLWLYSCLSPPCPFCGESPRLNGLGVVMPSFEN